MQIILTILQMVPAILEIIGAVEKLIPDSGKGSEKLQMVKDIVKVTYEESDDIMPHVEKIVNVAVASANKTGAFKKPTPKSIN